MVEVPLLFDRDKGAKPIRRASKCDIDYQRNLPDHAYKHSMHRTEAHNTHPTTEKHASDTSAWIEQ